MMREIIFRRAAELELQEAYDWYEERERGLGAEFMRCADGCVQMIRRQPEIFPATTSTFGRAYYGDFPIRCCISFRATASLCLRFSLFARSEDLEEPRIMHLAVSPICVHLQLKIIDEFHKRKQR